MQTFSQQVHLEEGIDSNGTDGSWAWRDEQDPLSSPKAPGPCAPLPVPVQAERDLNPDRVWSLSVGAEREPCAQ
ncbi:hypothetical protein ACIPMU_35585 [Streptomyces cyaneofuscatus]|uniref:hypothetical protein n=1 Tax=Streptomyces cyaneofuscatus TaxID=66883 RepID=UPI00382495E7